MAACNPSRGHHFRGFEICISTVIVYCTSSSNQLIRKIFLSRISYTTGRFLAKTHTNMEPLHEPPPASYTQYEKLDNKNYYKIIIFSAAALYVAGLLVASVWFRYAA